MRTALTQPPLAPYYRTIATRRTIDRLDRIARALLHACWFVINAALWVTVMLVLWLERMKRGIEDPLPVGWVRVGKGHAFRCMWCGSLTFENEEFQLTCCLMEARRCFDDEMMKQGKIA